MLFSNNKSYRLGIDIISRYGFNKKKQSSEVVWRLTNINFININIGGANSDPRLKIW